MRRRLVVWGVAAVLWVDLAAFAVVRAVSRWLRDWLSVSQRTQERALIAAVLAVDTLYRVCPPRTGWSVSSVCVGVLGVWSLWGMHRCPAAVRMKHVARTSAIVVRCALLGMQGLVILWAISGVRSGADAPAKDALWVAASASWTLAVYLTSLPEEQDPPGRKRRLALAELKAMFGAGWMPEAQPEGVRG